MNKKRIIVSVLIVASIIGIGLRVINNSIEMKNSNAYTTIKGDISTLGDTKLAFRNNVAFKNHTTEISKDGIKKDVAFINMVAELSNEKLSDSFIKENKKFFKKVNRKLFSNESSKTLKILDDTSILYMGNMLNTTNNLKINGILQDKDKNIKDFNIALNIEGFRAISYTSTRFIRKENDTLIIGLDIGGIDEEDNSGVEKFGVIKLNTTTLKYDISIDKKVNSGVIQTPILSDNKNFYYLDTKQSKDNTMIKVTKGDLDNVNKREVVNKIDINDELEDIKFDTFGEELYLTTRNDDKTLNIYIYNIKNNSFKEYKNLKFDILDTKGKESYISDTILKNDKLILINKVRKNNNSYIYDASTLVEVLDLNANKSLYTGRFENNPYLVETISMKK